MYSKGSGDKKTRIRGVLILRLLARAAVTQSLPFAYFGMCGLSLLVCVDGTHTSCAELSAPNLTRTYLFGVVFSGTAGRGLVHFRVPLLVAFLLCTFSFSLLHLSVPLAFL